MTPPTPPRQPSDRRGVLVLNEHAGYFPSHWAPVLADRGWDTFEAPVGDRARALRALSRTVEAGRAGRLLATVGEIRVPLAGIASLPGVTSTAYTTDDEWRFFSVGRYLGRYFDHVVTCVPGRVADYRAHGGQQVRAAQWGANTDTFRPSGLPRRYEVLLLGAPHPDRVVLCRELLATGVPLHIFGRGWERYPEFAARYHGAVPDADLPRVLSQAAIVLNPMVATAGVPALKARPFETAACGAFQLTQDAPGLAECYEPGREIATWTDARELPALIHHYLEHVEERETMARAALATTLARHTVRHRLDVVLGAFDDPPIETAAATAPILLVALDGATPGPDAALPRVRVRAAASADAPALIDRTLAEVRAEGHDDLLVAFAERGVEYDRERLDLLSFGLEHDRARGVWLNLAPFEVVDGRGRTFAYSLIDRHARLDPAGLPLSSIMCSARTLAERVPSLGSARFEALRDALHEGVARGEFEHIDLRAGLYRVRGEGATSLPAVYESSVRGHWDVRTRSYGRAVIEGVDLPGAFGLARGLVARRAARRR